MMDPAPSGGDGRKRGKRNKGKQQQGRRKRPQKGKGGGRKPNHTKRAQGFVPPEHSRDDLSVLGGRQPKVRDKQALPTDGPPDGFTLFCAYHLGITPDDGYKEPRLDEVAKRFRLSSDDVSKLLSEHGIDDRTMRGSAFDLKSAKLDIRLCPEGISRTETARELYEEYLETRGLAS